MHVLAILFTLISLGLALGIIGGMLFAHRTRIIEALTGRSAKSDSGVIFVTFEQNQAAARPVRRLPMTTLPPLPLAA